MPATSTAPYLRISRLLGLVALACVILLTLLDRGATRAYSTPWLLVLWLAPGAALASLVLRSLMPGEPLRLPSAAWSSIAGAAAACVVISAAASEFRGPSLLVAFAPLGAFAAFFLVYDWLQENPAKHRTHLLLCAGQLLLLVVLLSVGRWAFDFITSNAPSLAERLQARNPHPLGHSNYTAGLAVLALPCFAGLAFARAGRARLLWITASGLSLLMLFSSGSRAGVLALAPTAVVALWFARLDRRTFLLVLLACAALGSGLALAHPRTRAMIFPSSDPAASLDVSDRQRSSMLSAAVQMGADRPLLGWGPGTTPLVFPRYRAHIDGGVENVLQLHSTPAQIWADCGVAGLACAIAFIILATRAAWRVRTSNSDRFAPAVIAAIALFGYGVFSLFDYQLDVPIFSLALAAIAALLAPSPASIPRAELSANIAALAALSLVLVGLFARPDSTAVLNTRGLAIADDPAKRDNALQLLYSSVGLNPDQEIAHFNLGWLQLTDDPARAEKHFRAAARLVPDKRGLYFGIALARINLNRPNDPLIERALALECLNDPLFLASPWWRRAEFAGVRAATRAQLSVLAESAARKLESQNDPRASLARYIAALAGWMDGYASPPEVLVHAWSAEQKSYFASDAAMPNFASSKIVSHRNERIGYPVLMRDLDLPPPVDVLDVQENLLAVELFDFLFPPKGWLPAPVLVELFERTLKSP